MAVEYVADENMTNAVADLIGDENYEEFAPIREQELLFLVAAMVKTDKDDVPMATSGDPVIVRRVGPADAVFLTGHFKVYICQMRWEEANDVQRKAMLHRALMKVDVVKSETGIKITMRKPDVVTFQQTIVRFGAWEEELILLRNNLQAAKKKQVETVGDSAKSK